MAFVPDSAEPPENLRVEGECSITCCGYNAYINGCLRIAEDFCTYKYLDFS